MFAKLCRTPGLLLLPFGHRLDSFEHPLSSSSLAQWLDHRCHDRGRWIFKSRCPLMFLVESISTDHYCGAKRKRPVLPTLSREHQWYSSMAWGAIRSDFMSPLVEIQETLNPQRYASDVLVLSYHTKRSFCGL